MKIEQLPLQPTAYVPNSPLPVLVYRDVLPSPRDEGSVTQFLTRHNTWEKGGTWGHDPRRHFHPNTHECYGIFQGHSRLRLGVGKLDESDGEEVDVQTGDVIVLPAGTAHSWVVSSEDYRFIGVYPAQAPHWRNEYGDKPLDLAAIRMEISSVEFPHADPVTGEQDALLHFWKASPTKAH